MFSPIIVFGYNRPQHLKKVLSALAVNPEAPESDLFVFIDGPKTEQDKPKNEDVVAVAESFQNGFFKSVTITRSEFNKGLAASVISGVTGVIEKYGRVIVTEDDSVCSPYYLHFMNEALTFYENDKEIWSIGGYSVPLQVPAEYDKDIIKLQRCCSYAWGTWADRWKTVDWDVKDYRCFAYDPIIRRRFNRWGNDRSLMLDAQMLGDINSWAIRFEYSMFKQNRFNIMPVFSYINTIGHDGSGTHGKTNFSQNDRFATDLTKALPECHLDSIEIDEQIRLAYNSFFDISRKARIKKKALFFLRQHKKLHRFVRMIRGRT